MWTVFEMEIARLDSTMTESRLIRVSNEAFGLLATVVDSDATKPARVVRADEIAAM